MFLIQRKKLVTERVQVLVDTFLGGTVVYYCSTMKVQCGNKEFRFLSENGTFCRHHPVDFILDYIELDRSDSFVTVGVISFVTEYAHFLPLPVPHKQVNSWACY